MPMLNSFSFSHSLHRIPDAPASPIEIIAMIVLFIFFGNIVILKSSSSDAASVIFRFRIFRSMSPFRVICWLGVLTFFVCYYKFLNLILFSDLRYIMKVNIISESSHLHKEYTKSSPTHILHLLDTRHPHTDHLPNIIPKAIHFVASNELLHRLIAHLFAINEISQIY